MPQLVPFYFLNQLTIAFIILGSLLVILSKVILPYILQVYVIRMFITKL
jgi:F-type H+-transporting ATPase subunit 8